MSWQTGVAFLYVCLFSQLIGLFPWYKGLALGCVARVSQTQLLQPFFTIAAAMILLSEALDFATAGFAVLVVGLVAVGRRAAIVTR
jgi:drug/metabolite transporter (DMT)-like permease